MPAPDHLTSRAELAARWRADAQVFRRYGSAGRARMLERLADELEQCAAADAGAVVDLDAAAALSGFTRGHLRRLYRAGRLTPAAVEGGEPLFRVADLPRKSGTPPSTPDQPIATAHLRVVREVIQPTQTRRSRP